MGSKFIKRGSHLRRVAKNFQDVVCRRGIRYSLTDLGRELMVAVVNTNYIFIPLQLRYVKSNDRIDVRYYLDGYFRENGGMRVPKTLIYNIKAIFLKKGEITKSPIEADDVVAVVRHIDKNCGTIFNTDNKTKTEAYPTIAYLFWYTALTIENIKETNLKHLVAKFPQKIFTKTRKINNQQTLWKIETPYGGTIICQKCTSNKCQHVIQHIKKQTNTLSKNVKN